MCIARHRAAFYSTYESELIELHTPAKDDDRLEHPPTRTDYRARRSSRHLGIVAMVATAIGWLCGSFSFAVAESGAKHIYVANFASSSLSIFPLGGNGNVASLFTQ